MCCTVSLCIFMSPLAMRYRRLCKELHLCLPLPGAVGKFDGVFEVQECVDSRWVAPQCTIVSLTVSLLVGNSKRLFAAVGDVHEKTLRYAVERDYELQQAASQFTSLPSDEVLSGLVLDESIVHNGQSR